MAPRRILVVDDEKEVASVTAAILRREGYEAVIAHSGAAALKAVATEPPDLVLLDVMMPDMDGFEFLRLLRRRTDVPVIFISGKDADADKVLGLRLGADDYVAKPYSRAELTARIAAVLHRAAHGIEAADGAVRFGTAEADLGRRELRVGGHPREVTPKEFDLLACLLKARGKALTREQILEKVWGYEKGLDLSTRTVDQHVARLRRKLRGERNRIVTVAKNGYRVNLDGRP
ncbi:response regulator transcription factor [bacterium]|nr:MAG: response regulator transcription factor [bacterium]